mmetsp:Transcript_11314/g.27708  ORF Transcript_11314/g.27708 Transcript_11314/m.27708 type:complete len:268 (-) Transcript_11314:61-864(-)
MERLGRAVASTSASVPPALCSASAPLGTPCTRKSIRRRLLSSSRRATVSSAFSADTRRVSAGSAGSSASGCTQGRQRSNAAAAWAAMLRLGLSSRGASADTPSHATSSEALSGSAASWPRMAAALCTVTEDPLRLSICTSCGTHWPSSGACTSLLADASAACLLWVVPSVLGLPDEGTTAPGWLRAEDSSCCVTSCTAEPSSMSSTSMAIRHTASLSKPAWLAALLSIEAEEESSLPEGLAAGAPGCHSLSRSMRSITMAVSSMRGL